MGAPAAYRVPRHPAPVDLRLDGNEGAAPDDALLDALRAVDAETLRRYPSTAALEARLAARHGVAPAQVLVTAGADDALMRAARAVLGPGRALVLPEPTFEMIRRFVAWAGGTVQSVPWPTPDYPLADVLAAIDDQTRAIAVVSPNNPTGGVATAAQLRALSAAAPGVQLWVDLAYVEFADEDLTQVALGLPDTLVFRTLSKAWGLAGLRVGYVMGPAAALERLRAVGLPYPCAAPSLAVAGVALDQVDIAPFVAQVRAERAALEAQLAGLGGAVSRSSANFAFARTPLAGWLRDGLAGLGIGVRTWPGSRTLGDAVRVTCPGGAADLVRLQAALATVTAPEALLFDMDGVLADVSGSYREAIRQTAATFGVPVTAAQIAAAKAAGDANNDWILTRRLLAAAGVEVDLATVKATFEDLYQGTADAVGLHAVEGLIGDRDGLARLAARLPLGIVTGRPRGDAERFLARFDLRGFFQAVVTMEDAPLKPDPAPVRRALDQLGVTRAWLVGDTPDDVRAARAAGVLPIAVCAPGEADADGLLRAGAARVLPTWMDLEELLP